MLIARDRTGWRSYAEEKVDVITFCARCGASTAGPNLAAQTADKVIDASRDAWLAFRFFAFDPVGGLPGAFRNLGESRAAAVGVAFGVAFALSVLIAVYRVLPEWGRPHGFTAFLKILIAAIVPFVSLMGASLVFGKLLRASGTLAHDCFLAGAALLPFALVALLAGILGMANMEVLAVISLFAVCLNILTLFTGLTRICMTTERAATIAIPLILLATAWFSKIIYAALMKEL